MGTDVEKRLRETAKAMTLEEQMVAIEGYKEEVLWNELHRRSMEKDTFIKIVVEATKEATNDH